MLPPSHPYPLPFPSSVPHPQIDGAIFSEDPPSSTWTQLPELPAGALPRLARLHLDCVGQLGMPASWCR